MSTIMTGAPLTSLPVVASLSPPVPQEAWTTAPTLVARSGNRRLVKSRSESDCFPQPTPTGLRELCVILVWEKAVGLSLDAQGRGNPLNPLLALTSASFFPAGLLLMAPLHPLAREQLPRAETVAERGAPHPGTL